MPAGSYRKEMVANACERSHQLSKANQVNDQTLSFQKDPSRHWHIQKEFASVGRFHFLSVVIFGGYTLACLNVRSICQHHQLFHLAGRQDVQNRSFTSPTIGRFTSFTKLLVPLGVMRLPKALLIAQYEL